MLFSKNQQTIASLQSNNTGEDLNAQNQPLQFTGKCDILARYGNSAMARVELMPEPTTVRATFSPNTLHYGSTARLLISLPQSYLVPLLIELEAVDADSAAALSLPRSLILPARRGSEWVSVPVLAFGPGMQGGQWPVGVRARVRAASAEARAEIASVYSWRDVGSPISMAEVAQAPSLATRIRPADGGTRLAIASIDTQSGDASRLAVRESDLSNGWQLVGPGALNPVGITSVSQSELLVRPDIGGSDSGEPTVLAFSQGNGVAQNVFVVRFDASTGRWRDLSDTQSRLNTRSGSRAVQPTLTSLGRDSSNRLRTGLAFIEDGALQFLWFDGTAWHAASPPAALAPRVRDAHFLYSADGIVRLVWVDDGDAVVPVKAARLNLNGGGWSALAPPPVPPAQPGSMRLAHFAASAGSSTIVWSQSTLPAQVAGARYMRDSGSWMALPVDSPPDPNASLSALTLSRNGLGPGDALVYATDAGASARTVWVRRLNASIWVNAAVPDVGEQRVVGLSAFEFFGLNVAGVRRSDDGAQHTLQVRAVIAP